MAGRLNLYFAWLVRYSFKLLWLNVVVVYFIIQLMLLLLLLLLIVFFAFIVYCSSNGWINPFKKIECRTCRTLMSSFDYHINSNSNNNNNSEWMGRILTITTTKLITTKMNMWRKNWNNFENYWIIKYWKILKFGDLKIAILFFLSFE